MKKSLLVGSGIISLFLIFVGLRWNSAPFLSVKNYHCVEPAFISEDYFLAINNRIGQLLQDNVAAHGIISRVSKEFPLISKIVMAYRPTVIHIKMHTQEPLCCINNSLILTQEQQFFAKNSFSHKALCHIPFIEVAQEKILSAPWQICSLLGVLPVGFDQVYDLELISEHCVHLVDKKNCSFRIISSLTDTKMAQLLEKCELIKNNISERKGFDKGAKWIADTRFSDHIIAYKT